MRPWLIVVCCTLAGCGSGGETNLIGTWHGPAITEKKKVRLGAELTLDKEHHFRELFGNMDVQGTWKLDDSRLVLTTQTVNGLDVAEAKQRMLANAAKATYPELVREMAGKLDTPVILEVSKDAKALRSAGKTVAGETLYTRG